MGKHIGRHSFCVCSNMDAGANVPTNSLWTGIASSGYGTKLVAVAANDSAVYTSTNSGASWISNNVPNNAGAWSAVASSTDGTKLAAAQNYGGIYTSTNSGVTWQQTDVSQFAMVFYRLISRRKQTSCCLLLDLYLNKFRSDSGHKSVWMVVGDGGSLLCYQPTEPNRWRQPIKTRFMFQRIQASPGQAQVLQAQIGMGLLHQRTVTNWRHLPTVRFTLQQMPGLHGY